MLVETPRITWFLQSVTLTTDGDKQKNKICYMRRGCVKFIQDVPILLFVNDDLSDLEF